ncbi:AI-2E family transporter [Bacteroides sp. 519]|uniref:AI-2E family transporter n=1 Tax=Bacteroides sp. 519 TaxID=2302937 RepID=UPI0013D077C4|nr:AI-2E family transporter [Bacteroides sp. 519]NDV59306.1 AI-2E family transporter [Bacteroides sp. 519]
MLEKKITFDSFIRFCLGFAIVIGVLTLIDRLSGVLLPFFIAWLIAYLIYPIVKFFQYKLRFKNRALSIACTLLLLLIIILLVIWLLIPPMISEFVKVKDLLVTFFTTGIQNSSANVPDSLTEFLKDNIDITLWSKWFSEENIMNTVRTALPKLWVLFSESISVIFSILASAIVILYVVFILLDYETIATGWIRLIPRKYRSFSRNLLMDVEQGMNKYFRGQALVALCVGILFSIGFLIIDFPMAIGLGLFIGALNLVPYLQIVGFLPTIMLAILKAADTGENFWFIILSALIVFAVVQLIQDGYIVPRIMGKITGLNPAIILLSLSIWGSLMGFVGLIIALPLTSLILSYYHRFIIGHEPIVKKIRNKPQKKEKSKN